ncbi:MAG: hypothetical protein KTR13_09705 [Saprospiraceae bacterium]|nr:hypothetical protein [Saprospiraceae bacterium]
MQFSKTTDPKKIGTYISVELYHCLKQNYQENFPTLLEQVFIQKALITDLLEKSDEITGIRFMYGLKDLKNPNSLTVFLIPCTSLTSQFFQTQALLSQYGYFDQSGNKHTLPALAEMLHQYVKYIDQFDGSLPYREIIRGNYYGKDALNDLLSQEDCSGLIFHFGAEGQKIAPILQPIQGKEELDIYMDYSSLCPPFCNDPILKQSTELMDRGLPCPFWCPDWSFDSDEQVQGRSIQHFLSSFKAFRDADLLNYNGGGIVYEMYYFITPIIVKLQSSLPSAEGLEELYSNYAIPFQELIRTHKKQEAVELLRSLLDQFVLDYHAAYLE